MSDQAPRTWQLQLHGDSGVHGPGGLVLPLRGRAAALVALVALEPGIRRSRVAALLWPDADGARNNLRQQLARFRSALGRELVTGVDELRLADGVTLAEPPDGAELLAGEPVAADDFGAWLEAMRLRERVRWQDALRARLAEAEARSDLDALLALATGALALRPQDESAHAAVMRAHLLRGEAAQGLRVFERLERLLPGGVSSPTRQLAEALRRGDTPPHPAAGAHAELPATLKRPPRLAGRTRELAAAQQAWSRQQAVLLEGEAGLGKSRLLAELLGPQGTPAPALVVAGRPGEAGAPYATLERLLQPLLAAPRAGLGATTQDTLQRWLQAAPGSAPLRAGALQQAVAELLAQHAVPAVALDDLHFADEATVELLAELAANDAGTRRWAFAQRPAEATAAGERLRGTLLEVHRLAVVTLAPLDAAAAAELVDALGIAGLEGPRFAEPLVRHTGGNPLFLLETLKQGLQDGSLARGELPHPSSVGTLIEQRLQRLSEPALNLARVAAVAGTDFGIALAEHVIGVRAVQLAGAWAELEAAQVLRDDAFAHDLVHDAARRLTPAVLTRHLHGAVAAFLQQHGAAPARVAHHWLGAGQPQRALPPLHEAARQAALALRRREELAFLEQAAAIEEAAGLPEAFDTLVDIWDCYDTADRSGFDGPLLERIDRAAELGSAIDERRAVAHRVRSHTLLRLGRLQEAAEVGERGLQLAARAGAWRAQAEIAQGVAAAWHALGEPQRGLDLLRRLLPDLERLEGDPGTKGTYYMDLASMLSATDRHAEAAAYQARGVALALEAGNTEHAGMGRTNQGFTLLMLGRVEPALAMLEDARRLLAASDAAAGAGLTLTLHLGRALRDAGRYGQALETTQEAVDSLATQLPYLRPLALGQLGLNWLHLGQTARAQQAWSQAVEGGPLAPWMQASLKTLQARIARAQGLDPGALLHEALALAPRAQRRLLRCMLLAERCRTAQAGAEALAEADEAAAEAASLGLGSAELALRGLAAPLALRLGEPARARALAARARQLSADTHPFDLYPPELWLALAEAHQGLGDGDAAREALGQAADWVLRAARHHVPAPFLDGFLRRNPANATLAQRLQREPALAGLLAPVLALAGG